jgi:hypothetical protein
LQGAFLPGVWVVAQLFKSLFRLVESAQLKERSKSMADKAKVQTLRRKSRIAALEVLRSRRGFSVPPRKAMSLAKKKSKGLPYPLPPFAGLSLPLLFREAQGEWKALGRHRRLALPIIALVALTTWEKERETREARWDEVERQDTIDFANAIYAQASAGPKQRTRGFWPFNRGGKNKN